MARGSKFFKSNPSELTVFGRRVKSNDCSPNGGKNGNDELALNIGFVTFGVVADVVGVVLLEDEEEVAVGAVGLLGERPG